MSITILDSTAIDGTISITSIANASTNTNRFLVSDSGVVKYRTGAQLRSDIGAGTSSTVGTVTSIGGTGTVSGLTLSGTVTVSGNLTLAGALVLTSANVTSGLGFTPYNATNPAGYTTNTGTVTSVGISHAGNAFTAGSAITTSGTLAITMAGTSAQYINGAGNLTTFPAIPQGDITAVVAGTGISGGGTSGSVTITNSDRGSSQFIFKNVASDSGTAVADNNNDTLSIVGAGSVTTAVVGDILTITGSDDNDNFYVTGASYASGTLTLTRNGLSDLTATGFPTNNNQLTNGAGYTTNTGTTTASNTQTFTNKSGSNLQWTNDAGYVTSSGGSMSSWNIRGDSGTNAAVTDGQSVTIQGGAGITTTSNGYIVDIVNDITNNNQLTNGAGYTTNTGTTTASNSQTFTNKGGNISQWTNNSGYITSASLPTVSNATVSVTTGTGLDGATSFTLNQSANKTIALTLDLNELGAGGTLVATDSLVAVNGTTSNKQLISSIPLSIFNNNAGWTSNVGDITGVTAGTGISGGGTSGTVTITNSDRGSSQNIFKNVASDSGTAVADNNNDTLTISGGSNVTTSVVGDVLTINATINPGDITGVTATTPLTGGGTSGNITVGIQTASASQAGALSAANWTTFNNKTTNTGTVTSVAATVQGTAMSIGGSPITSSGTLAFGFTGGAGEYIDGSGDLQGFPSIPQGDITAVVAGVGLTGGGTSGSVTLNNSITNNNQLTNGAGYITAASLQGVPAILSNGVIPSLNTGITAAEVRSLIGAGTSSTTGTVTSVNASIAGSAINVSGGAITTSGTLAFTFGGGVGEYIDGAGDLQAFPSIPTGDITGVTAGSGMTGGGTSGTVTLNVIGSTGITANANNIAIDSTVATLVGVQTFTNKSGNISMWTNDSGYTNNVGDITGVTAGSGMSGGGTSGTVTLTNSDKGSSQNIFKTVAVSGQSSVVADSNSDTLTLAAGNNITLTTNATTDTVTITANINPGDITGVTATSPLTGGGTSGTVALGIQTASASQAGALSAANWTTFNNKTTNTGTVTSVNASIGGSALAVSGGAITTAGTLAFAYQGNSGEYIDGAGDLQNFPGIPQGDITAVVAGTGMTGGGTSGSVTLNVIGSTGITANANNIAIDATVATLAGTQTFTNKSGNISQWTNDSAYITAASLQGVPAILSNGTTPSLNTGISAAEVRSLIGAGTSSLTIGTTSSTAKAGNTTTITSAQASAITANTAKVGITSTQASNITTNNAKVTDSGTPAILSNGTVPSLNSGITAAEVRSLIGAGTSSSTGTVTSVGTTGSVSGITLSGTVTTSGSLTLGGTLSLTSANVTGGLGFTPYNATNPAGYTTNTGTTTASNSQTFTNKSGSNNQWINDAGYITSYVNTTYTAGSGLALTGTVFSNTSPNIVQTTITGNAGSATALQTARRIAGVFFNGTADISLNNSAITNGAGYTTNTGTTTASNSQTFTNKSGNVSQWTNDAGYLTSAPGGTIYTPDIWAIDPGFYNQNAQVLQCNSQQFFTGTTNSGPNGGLAGALLINDVGMYEITYQAAANVSSGVGTRQVPALYITESPPGGPEANIPGSLMANYLRLPGSNQGGFTSFSNTCYFNVTQQQTTFALKIVWLDGSNRNVNIYDANSVPSTISIKRIT